MKRFILLITTACFICSCSVRNISTKSFSSLKEQNLKGPVRQFEQKTYSINSFTNELIEDTCCINRNTFDKKGRNIKQETLNNKAELRTLVIQSFYKNGLIKDGKHFNGNGILTYREEFELDEKGLYKGGTAWREEGKVYRYFKILKQTEFGSWSILQWYTPEMKLMQTQTSTFEGNKLLKQVWENADGKIARNQTAVYNEKGDRIEMAVSAIVPGAVAGKDSTRLQNSRFDESKAWRENRTDRCIKIKPV